jgi:bifunctional non-homologous end joining protein LigD
MKSKASKASKSTARQAAVLDVGGTPVDVSNLGKVLYPKTGFTKGEVIDYYVRISPVLLPHLKNRPITLKRSPDGVEGFFFYEKQCPPHRPGWVKTTDVPRSEGGLIHYCVIDTLPALVWAANLADLELHTFLHKAPAIGRPTALAFDLDPGAPAALAECCAVALRIRALFDALGLKSFPKTSGSKGMQVYVPLNSPTTYDRTKSFARTVAEGLERATPDAVVSSMKKVLRKGKIFVDWSQNDDHKTTINVYSLRAKERPTVSTPVTWKEVEAGTTAKGAARLIFGPDDVVKRVKREEDLFAPVLTLKQKLPSLKALEAALESPRGPTSKRSAKTAAPPGKRARKKSEEPGWRASKAAPRS